MLNQLRDLPLVDLKPVVQVFAIMNEQHQYEDVGTGTLQIVTDSDIPEPQHYIEVTSQDTKELILRSRLQSRNNFQRQKNAIICWEDIEQLVSEELAISFEKPEECDSYWKLICEKIGKNYLEINGRQTLESPTENNLAYILQKSKNSYNLTAFRIINSEEFMHDLRKVFQSFKEKSDKMGTGIVLRIMKQIFSHTDHKVMANLLIEPNFSFLLELYQQNTDVDYPSAYKSKVKIRQLIPLSEKTSSHIQIFHNYVFFRDYMIDLSRDMALEQMLNIWIRQTEIIILNGLIQQKILQQLSSCYKDHKSPEIEENILIFLFEIMGMLKLAESDTIRKKYVESFYESGIIKSLEEMLKNNQFKVLQIFDFLCMFNPKQFLNFFRDQFRQNPSLSLNRIISKEFSSTSNRQMVTSIITFLNTMLGEIVEKKQFLQFFSGTFLFSVFSNSVKPERNLAIIHIILQKSGRLSKLVSVLLKTKFFYKIELSQKLSKKFLLDVFKTLKLILLINGRSKIEKSIDQIEDQGKINEEIIESGVFGFCLEFLKKSLMKNCLLVSAMLENISLLAQMEYNQYTKIVQQYDWEIDNSPGLFRNYMIKIREKQGPKIENYLTRGDMLIDGRKKQHFKNLEAEEEEKYFDEDEEFDVRQDKQGSEDKQLKELLEMKKQIQRQRKVEEERNSQPKRKQEDQSYTISFNIEMEDQ